MRYKSPSQRHTATNAVDIDTRADVYALGVILYELLTGATPIMAESMRKAAVDEMLRLIREQDAPTPSSRLSSSENTPTVAANRQTEPRKLGRFIRGELDWIVIKALSKERDRRYETANGFARDIERFLNDEAVAAGPPSSGYRVWKFVRRNRAHVIAASLVLLSLAGGIVGTTLGLFEARRQQGVARIAEANTREERDRALKAEAQARTEAEKAKAINDFLTTDLLTQAEPANNAEEDQVTLLEVLDRAADKVGERFKSQPVLEAALRDSIGQTYHDLASWDKAERQQRARLELARRPGAAPAELYLAEGELAHVLRHRGRVDEEVLAMAKSASDGLKRVLGPDHPDTLASMNDLFAVCPKKSEKAKAQPLLARLIANGRKAFREGSPQLAQHLAIISLPLLETEAFAEAEPLLRECLAIRQKSQPDDWRTFNTMSQLGGVLVGHKKYADAEPLLLKGYEGMNKREKSIPAQGRIRLSEALDRLIKLYTATDKPDEVKKWQAERANYPEIKPTEKK